MLLRVIMHDFVETHARLPFVLCRGQACGLSLQHCFWMADKTERVMLADMSERMQADITYVWMSIMNSDIIGFQIH